MITGALKAQMALLKPNGGLWGIRPKGPPEVVSFSSTHTAEKFVIPVSARRQ